jgi:hypothetical protein
MKVAVPREKHSNWFGHRASWQTVCNPLQLSSRLTLSYSGPAGKRRLSQPGLPVLIAPRWPHPIMPSPG